MGAVSAGVPRVPQDERGAPEVRLVNRVLPSDPRDLPDDPEERLFAPEGSAGGCASGECLPEKPLVLVPPVPSAPSSYEPAPSVPSLYAPAPSGPGLYPPAPSGPTLYPPDPSAPPAFVAPPSDIAKWKMAVDSLRLENPRHGKSLSYARVMGFTPEGVRVSFPPDAAFHRTTVLGMSRAIVEASLSKIFGRPTKILEETGATALQSAPKSIAEVEASDRQVRETSIDGKVRDHPAVRNVLRFLGGNIEHIQYLEAPKGDAVRPVAAADEES